MVPDVVSSSLIIRPIKTSTLAVLFLMGKKIKYDSNSRESEFDDERKAHGGVPVGKADERGERANTKCYAKYGS